LRTLEARCLADRPAEVATLLATGAGRSFATGAAFERALDLVGPPGDRRCFVAYDGARPVAALAGRVERRFGGAWFRAQPHGTPAGPVFSSGEQVSAAGTIWSCLERVAREEGWLGGDVTLYGPAAADRALWPAGGRMRSDHAHVLDLSEGVEAWRASLSNAGRRVLAQAGKRGVTITRSSAPEDLAATYSLFLEQARRWGLSKVRPLAFYRALLDPPSDAALWIARMDGRIVSGILGFVSPEETYLWWSGSSPDARPVRAYPATIAHIAANCGSARVNLGFSGGQARLSEFKEGLGARDLEVPIVELPAHARTPWHRLLVAARAQVRKSRAR